MEYLARRVLAVFLGLWASFSLGLLAVACGPVPEDNAAAAHMEDGRLALAGSRPNEARQHFASALTADPVSAEAACGLALSELLVLPGSPAGRALTAELGLRPLDPAVDLFGETGVLADLAHTLDPDVVRRRLLDRLDVPDGGWDGIGGWLAGLPATTSPASLAKRAGALADELEIIASWFEAAADPRLEPLRLVVPGGLFHLDADLILGPAEARALAGAARAVRALLQTMASYRFSDRPLAELAELEGQPLADALSALLADTGPPATLEGVRDDLGAALDQLTAALVTGVTTGTRPGQVVAWGLVTAAHVVGLPRQLAALTAALSGPADLPDTVPSTRLDLSRLFDVPPALPAATPLFVTDETGRTVLGMQVFEELLAQAGASSPPLSLEPEAAPTLFASGRPAEGWLERWLAPLLDRFEADLGL